MDLPEDDPDTFANFLSWMYTTYVSLDDQSNWTDLCKLWVMADKYQVRKKGRREACSASCFPLNGAHLASYYLLPVSCNVRSRRRVERQREFGTLQPHLF